MEFVDYHNNDNNVEDEDMNSLLIALHNQQFLQDNIPDEIDESYEQELFPSNETGIDWISLADSLEEHLNYYYTCTQEYSTEAIYLSISRMKNQNIDEAAHLILNADHVLGTCKPCRHMINDRCFRKDCMFDHDLKSFPCRFWLYSQCTSGDACPFLHDLPAYNYPEPEYPPESEYYYQETTPQTNEYSSSTQPQEELFPSLQQSTTLPTPASSSSAKVSTSYLAALQKEPTVSWSNNQYSTTTSTKQFYAISCKSSGFSDLLTEGQFLVRFGSFSPSSTSVSSAKVSTQEWVSSGHELRHDYESLRKEARDLACVRNRFFDEATIAYLNGSKDIARNLSIKGREINDQMKSCHLQAAKALFRKRNPLDLLQQGIIDLHGLHVQEALDCLQELIPIFQQTELTRLKVITGTGHHTLGPQAGKARLFPNIRRLLRDDWQFPVKEITDVSGYAGGLLVTI